MSVYYERAEACMAYHSAAWRNEAALAQLAYLAQLQPEASLEELVSDANAIALELHPLCNLITIAPVADGDVLTLEKVGPGIAFKMHCYREGPEEPHQEFRVQSERI